MSMQWGYITKFDRTHAVSGIFKPDGTADYNLLSDMEHIQSNMHLQVNYTKHGIISYVLFFSSKFHEPGFHSSVSGINFKTINEQSK